MLTEHDLLRAYPIVTRMARGYPNAGEPADLAQTVMMRLWKDRGRFDPTRSLEHYIARTARNTFIQLARKNAARSAAYRTWAITFENAVAPDPETLLDLKRTWGATMERLAA